MTTDRLARAYLVKARARLKMLTMLLADGDYSDVVREAQEAVELATKGMLRRVGVEPPKWHDVGEILLEQAALFPPAVQAELSRVAAISRALRKERELSFYGDEDFIPTDAYDKAFAEKMAQDAAWVVALAEQVIG
jgi:HEPN domain-containing protein